MNDREMSSQDLRALADALDGLAEITERTGVSVNGYGDDMLSCGGLMVRLRWLPAPDEDDTGETPKAKPGRYVIDLT